MSALSFFAPSDREKATLASFARSISPFSRRIRVAVRLHERFVSGVSRKVEARDELVGVDGEAAEAARSSRAIVDLPLRDSPGQADAQNHAASPLRGA